MKTIEAVKYMISVWDEVAGNWREKPDHVQHKFLEAEKEIKLKTPTADNEIQILGEKANEFIKQCNVHGLVHAKEGGVINLSELLIDFVKYIKNESK